jgi:hypothetical protein
MRIIFEALTQPREAPFGAVSRTDGCYSSRPGEDFSNAFAAKRLAMTKPTP